MKNKHILCYNDFWNSIKTALFILGESVILLLLTDLLFYICSYTVCLVFHNSEKIISLPNLMCELWLNYKDRIIRIGIFACILYHRHFLAYKA